jgi:SAM-dependent methyltransferase
MTTPYDGHFFDDQSHGSYHSAREVVPLIIDLVHPTSVIDVGCGVGGWLVAFREQGVTTTMGIDGDYVDRARLRISAECFQSRDLTHRFDDVGRFDLALSLEVAEHLSPEHAVGFVESLCKLAPAIVFSAAIPGQGGTNHVNEQWPTYWEALFNRNGFACHDVFRPMIWNNARIGGVYRQNMFLYLHKDSAGRFDRNGGREGLAPAMRNLVHPEVLRLVITTPPSVGEIVRALPAALRMAVRRRLRG